jgi:putative PIN family toxin of toxin-antitoxin system
MRVVVDTNVLISGLFWGGRPRRVTDLAAAGRFQALTSVELLLELEDVLTEDYDVPQEQVDRVLRDVLSYAEMIVPGEETSVPVRDADDVKVIACAIAGGADCIVTADQDLLSLGNIRGISVVTPAQFLQERL